MRKVKMRAGEVTKHKLLAFFKEISSLLCLSLLKRLFCTAFRL